MTEGGEMNTKEGEWINKEKNWKIGVSKKNKQKIWKNERNKDEWNKKQLK